MKIMSYIYQDFDENVCQVVHLYVRIFLTSKMPIISYIDKKKEKSLIKPLSYSYSSGQSANSVAKLIVTYTPAHTFLSNVS